MLDEQLAAILRTVQIDPGNRGLAKIPGNNLFTATAGHFSAACRALWAQRERHFAIVTGFYIPSASPPAFETDGPLGAAFLARACRQLGIVADVVAEADVMRAVRTILPPMPLVDPLDIAIERGGPASDGVCRTMRGRDITAQMAEVNERFRRAPFIAIGDGGNEIGMGSIPHSTIVSNIPSGEDIHCVVPCEHLIVAGVSNWGAYALAAGLFAVANNVPPAGLFDAERERTILEAMVAVGPLVDGVRGTRGATVDGLSWDEYIQPLDALAKLIRTTSDSKLA